MSVKNVASALTTHVAVALLYLLVCARAAHAPRPQRMPKVRGCVRACNRGSSARSRTRQPSPKHCPAPSRATSCRPPCVSPRSTCDTIAPCEYPASTLRVPCVSPRSPHLRHDATPPRRATRWVACGMHAGVTRQRGEPAGASDGVHVCRMHGGSTCQRREGTRTHDDLDLTGNYVEEFARNEAFFDERAARWDIRQPAWNMARVPRSMQRSAGPASMSAMLAARQRTMKHHGAGAPRPHAATMVRQQHCTCSATA